MDLVGSIIEVTKPEEHVTPVHVPPHIDVTGNPPEHAQDDIVVTVAILVAAMRSHIAPDGVRTAKTRQISTKKINTLNS